MAESKKQTSLLLAMLSIICISALAPVAYSETIIPPTPAFQFINSTDGAGNLTSTDYRDTLHISGGENVTLQYFPANNTIRISSAFSGTFQDNLGDHTATTDVELNNNNIQLGTGELHIGANKLWVSGSASRTWNLETETVTTSTAFSVLPSYTNILNTNTRGIIEVHSSNDATNKELLRISSVGTDGFVINSHAIGTGTTRDWALQRGGVEYIDLNSGGVDVSKNLGIQGTFAITFGGNAGDRIYSCGANCVRFDSNGIEVFRFDTTELDVSTTLDLNGNNIDTVGTLTFDNTGAGTDPTFSSASSSNKLTLDGDLAIGLTDRLYFDATTFNNFMTQATSNIVSLFTGGVERIRFNSFGFSMPDGQDIIIDDGDKLRLDGDGAGDVYLHSAFTNNIQLVAGGVNVLSRNSEGVHISTDNNGLGLVFAI